MPILQAPLKAKEMDRYVDDPEKCDYVVRVDWIKTVPKDHGYWETGMFAVQHTACRLRNRFTIERLTQHFGLSD